VREHIETLNGMAVHYKIQGHGEPLVLIHGVGSCLEAWDRVASLLCDRFHMLSFDLRGHGQSYRAPGPYTLEDFSNDTLALADHLGFARFHLAGFSLGGLIAQQLAITQPQRLQRLALLATVAGRTEAERERVQGRLAAMRNSQNSTQHFDASLSRWFTPAFQARHGELIASLRQRNAGNDPDCYAASYRVLAQTDLGQLIDQITVPTLVMTGEEDQGSNPRMARFMSERIADARLEILPGLRHSLLIEAPERVAQSLRAFFGGEPREQ